METEKKNELIEYLRKGIDESEKWVLRKEIAVWSSVLLYFTALFGIYNVANNLNGNIRFLVILGITLILFSYLFLLFLFKQYGALASGMAYILANSYWITKIMSDNTIKEFDYTISVGGSVPDCIQNKRNEKYKMIRQCRIWKKLLIPIIILFQKLFCKTDKTNKTYDNLEVQESILYDMIILLTFFLIAYIIFKIKCA